jgi:hypothetical protein
VEISSEVFAALSEFLDPPSASRFQLSGISVEILPSNRKREFAIGAKNSVLERVKILLARNSQHTLTLPCAFGQRFAGLSHEPVHRLPVHLLDAAKRHHLASAAQYPPRRTIEFIERS